MKNENYRDFLLTWLQEEKCITNLIEKKEGKRPKQNVIWIISDQHRAQALSTNFDPNVHTPNLDIMSKNGVNFNRAVSGFPICCPFRASALTSKQHHKCMTGHEYTMPEGQKTIADVFNDNDYDTAYFGKWHLDGCRNNFAMHIVPPERRGGFKKWIGYENNNSQWNTWVHGHMDDKEVSQFKLDGYETDTLTDMMIDYIENQQDSDTPFFSVLSVQPPHEPYVAPAEYMRKYHWNDIELRPNVPVGEKYQMEAKKQLARYYAMVENIDFNIGRIMEVLRKAKLDLNTHIMFFSDHGDMMGSHGLYGKVVPYEESVRIPFIIGGAVPRYYGYNCGDCDAVISEIDIAPTTLGLCEIEKPEWMEGYDYSHYRFQQGNEYSFKSKDDEPQSAYIKSIIPREGCDKAWRGIVTRDGFKYVCFEDCEWLMFNINNDPYEQVNLAHRSEYRQKRRELHAILQSWIDKTEDNFMLPEREYL